MKSGRNSIRKSTSERHNATHNSNSKCWVSCGKNIILMSQPSQVRGSCHRALAQFHLSPRLHESTWYWIKKESKTAQQQVDRNGEQQLWVEGSWHRKKLTARCTICAAMTTWTRAILSIDWDDTKGERSSREIKWQNCSCHHLHRVKMLKWEVKNSKCSYSIIPFC